MKDVYEDMQACKASIFELYDIIKTYISKEKNYRYFEVDFARKYKEEGRENYVSDFSICIIGKDEPTPEEATEFCKEDLKSMGYDFVSNVTEISWDEAHKCFDMDEEKDLPVFTKNYYELYYFRGRKDTGSIYIKTYIDVDDYVDDDAFLAALVERGELFATTVDIICEVNSIDEETYRDMTGKR